MTGSMRDMLIIFVGDVTVNVVDNFEDDVEELLVILKMILMI